MNQIKVLKNFDPYCILESASVESTDGKRLAEVEKDYCLVDLGRYTFKLTREDFDFMQTVLELQRDIQEIE